MYRIFLMITLLVLPMVATANNQSTIDITPLIGYRFGGNFDNTQTATRIKLAKDVSYGLQVAWPMATNQQGELVISHYDTGIINADDDSPSDLMADNNIGVTYLHLGGNVKLSEGNLPIWISGGLGASYLAPSDDNLDDELRFSMNLGMNTRYTLSSNLSLTLGGRVYATFFNSDSAAFCNSDICNIHISNDVWIQSEVNAGLVFSF